MPRVINQPPTVNDVVQVMGNVAAARVHLQAALAAAMAITPATPIAEARRILQRVRCSAFAAEEDATVARDVCDRVLL